jgi:hypothetical protein
MRKILRLIFIQPYIELFKILKNPLSIFSFWRMAKDYDQSIKNFDNEVESKIRNGEHVLSHQWLIVGGHPNGKNPKYQPGTELYELYVINELKFQKELEETIKRQKEERMKELIQKYGEAIALKIINEELWIGMGMNHIYEVKGEYDLKVDNMINKVEQTILYFEKHKNRLGNDAYDFEITLESGKVVGWKNRANVATRNL